jgi:hypothetical protein
VALIGWVMLLGRLDLSIRVLNFEQLALASLPVVALFCDAAHQGRRSRRRNYQESLVIPDSPAVGCA